MKCVAIDSTDQGMNLAILNGDDISGRTAERNVLHVGYAITQSNRRPRYPISHTIFSYSGRVNEVTE
jgi:hypothetical protein